MTGQATQGTMNKKTIAALKGSIQKWERIVAGTGRDEGCKNCPLCRMFYWSYSCEGCPVALRVKAFVCGNTPYTKWIRLVDYETGQTADTPNRKKAAIAELRFLKSLLPK